jgi:NADH dehydrogenase/NADH:ubiquinone oxidoreductase subunit G
MPVDETNLTALHVRFGNSIAIQKQLIETITNKSVYMTGPLMSSKESYAEKRNYLISYVEDQISRGVYKTIQREMKTKDPMTGADKTVTIVEVSLKDGIPERQEEAVLAEFGIKVFNFAIDELSYEQNVEKQIQQQQQIAMEVQTAIANAKRAEQAAITAEKDGQTAVMKAKYEKEVEKIKEVTLAQQRLEVASLDARAAEQKKRELILLGEGEGARKRLIMEADGALEKKLDAFIRVNELYAEAVKGYQGSLVPTVVMGENTGRQPAGGGVAELMQLFTAMAAKNLALDMGVAGANRTKK